MKLCILKSWYIKLPMYHKLNEGYNGFIIILTKVFYLFSYVYVKFYFILNLNFGQITFFHLFYHVCTLLWIFWHKNWDFWGFFKNLNQLILQILWKNCQFSHNEKYEIKYLIKKVIGKG
jgi:hypothetical protein